MAIISFSQSIRKIDDPHIRAQYNRMVFKSWGNFLPNPKYFLGTNINPHHTLTWGWAAPAQNGRYRKGADIRPLSSNGEQNQRTTLLFRQNASTRSLEAYTDEMGKTAVSELYHNTGGAISEVDPLWQLYYKRMLKEVYNYNLSTFTNKLSPKQRVYMIENGVIGWFDNEMQRLNERLHGAFNVTMTRGSRIINYHRIFLEYEAILNKWNNHKTWSEPFVKLQKENIQNQQIQNLDFSRWRNDDIAIMEKVIQDAKKL